MIQEQHRHGILTGKVTWQALFWQKRKLQFSVEIWKLQESRTLLEIILTNKPELFKDCGVSHVGISDHAMVYGLMAEKRIFTKTKFLSVRNLKKPNEKELQRDLQQ